jgi:hypothetical protein
MSRQLLHTLPWLAFALRAIPASGDSASTSSWLIPALLALAGVGITACFGYYQWNKSQAANAKLEAEKRTWERERLQLEHDLALERDHISRAVAFEEHDAAERRRRERETSKLRAHAQTIDEQTESYRAGLVSELRNVRILDMARPLDLRDLYVQVRVRDDVRNRYPRDAELTQAAGDDPETLLEQYDKDIAEQAHESLSPEEALSKHHRVAFLGDPGAGKTTLLRYLALTFANGDARIPIYVELRRFVDSAHDSLIEFVADDCAARYGFTMSTEAFESALTAGEAILLLDGLDETLGGDTLASAHDAYHAVAAEIDRVVTRYPTIGVAVTCRRAGWQGGLESFSVLDVLDFAWPQVQRFIEHWFDSDNEKANGLKATLSRNIRMRSLAANPLLLSLICMVYERELELPERRAELYSRCIEVLLREWDAHRGIKRFSRFTTDRKRDLLEELAWCFHHAGSRYLTEDDLLGYIRGYLPSIDISPEEAGAILGEVTSQYGLLKEQAHGLYGFLHLTLQEYFAAVAANERGESAIAYVAEHARHPWWEEVALLLAGRMADAAPLLKGILDGSNDTGHQDDIRHDRLLFAGRCLVGTPRVRQPGLREEIIREARRLCDETSFSLIATRASHVLAEIGDDDSLDHVLAAVVRRDDRLGKALLAGLRGVCNTATAERLAAMAADELDPGSGAQREALMVIVSARLPGAAQLLRSLMRDEDAARNAIDAAGELGEPVLADDVLAAMQMRENGGLNEHAARALARIGTPSAASVLLALNAVSAFNEEEILQAAIHLGGEAVISRLEKEVYDPDLSIFRRSAALKAMFAERDDDDVAFVLQVARDKALPWEFRWLAVEDIERSKISGEETIRLLCSDMEPMEIRVAAVATLAMWGDKSMIEVVRQAILDESLPSSLSFSGVGRTTTYTGSIARRLGKVVAGRRESALVGQLTSRLQSAFNDCDLERAEMVSSYLAPLGEDAPARLMLAFLKNPASQLESRPGRSDVWRIVTMLATPDTAPEFVGAMCETYSARSRIRWRFGSTIRKIADIASDPGALIEPLTRLAAQLDGGDQLTRDQCFEALDSALRYAQK